MDHHPGASDCLERIEGVDIDAALHLTFTGLTQRMTKRIFDGHCSNPSFTDKFLRAMARKKDAGIGFDVGGIQAQVAYGDIRSFSILWDYPAARITPRRLLLITRQTLYIDI